MGHALDQDAIWTDKNGNPHLIKNMSGRYALNCYSLLRRSAQNVGFSYSLYLHSIGSPDPDTAAADIFEDAVNREINEITNNPMSWLLNKPLMKALALRVVADPATRSEIEPRPAEDAIDLPEFRVKPEAKAPSMDDWNQQKASANGVFLVSEGSHEDYSVLAVFVGNRIAAQQYAAEHDRYERLVAVVEEFDDRSVGTVHEPRQYPRAYTQVTFVSRVLDAPTGVHLSGQFTRTKVLQDDDPQVYTNARPMSWGMARQQDMIEVYTCGPDFKLDEIKEQHRAKIRQVMAAVRDDGPKGDSE